MNHYIFTVSDTDKELEHRLEKQAWPVYAKTRFADDLKKGDQIIFYRAGNNMHKFLGVAKVNSVLSDKDKKRFVAIESIRIWNKPLPVENIFDKVGFIKNKYVYGVYFAGGITRINETDFKIIEKLGLD